MRLRRFNGMVCPAMTDLYTVRHDSVSRTFSVYQTCHGTDYAGLLDGILIAEYVDEHAANYICTQLNKLSPLEVNSNDAD